MKKLRKGTLGILTVLLLVFSLILPMSAVVSAGSQGSGDVRVRIVECPGEDGWIVPVSHEFGIKAEITNTLGSIVEGVEATIEIDGPAELWPVGEMPNMWEMGNLAPGQVTTVAWTLHCTGPGDVTITVDTNKGGPVSCTVEQREPAELMVECEDICETGSDCDTVLSFTATVTNIGDMAANQVGATLQISDPTKIGLQVGQTFYKPIGVLVAGASQSVTWMLETKEKAIDPGVDLTVVADGLDQCLGFALADAECTETVDIKDYTVKAFVSGMDSDMVAGYPGNGDPDWKWGVACGLNATPQYDQTLIDGWMTTTAIVSTEQLVGIRAVVRNWTDDQDPVRVVFTLPPDTEMIPDEKVQVWKTPNPEIFSELTPEVWEEGGTTYVAVEPGVICDCGEMDLRLYVKCTSESDDSIIVDVYSKEGGTGDWIFEDSNFTCDPANLYQDPKVHLTITPQIKVEECGDNAIAVEAVRVGQDMQVIVEAWNQGVTKATDVYFDVIITGDVSCEGVYPDQQPLQSGYSLGEIGPNGRAIWQVACTCLGIDPEDVTVTVENIRGIDYNTCEPVLEDNIDPVCQYTIDQIPFDVVIINPVTCEVIDQCEVYAVKAMLINWSETFDLNDVTVTLDIDGPAQLLSDSANPVIIPLIENASCADEWADCCGEMAPASVYEVTWMVECTGGGDTTFSVCAEVADPHMKVSDIFCPEYQLVTPQYDGAPDWSSFDPWDCVEGFPAMPPPSMVYDGPMGYMFDDAYDRWPVVVHQIPAETLIIQAEIVSPDDWDTMVATSQEFALTAVIVNNQEAHTLTNVQSMLKIMPEGSVTIVESPEMDFDLEPGYSKTLTWTLHGNRSAATLIAIDFWGGTNLCEDFEAEARPLMLHVYPAAHLEVEIGDMPMVVDVGDEFTVPFTVTNTGQADATEVMVTLAVSPDGSARPAPGDNGYTIDIGTLAGHGQYGSYSGNFELVCKAACATTITIDVEGYDEYGWHEKQVCQSTGTFRIDAGWEDVQLLREGDQETGLGWKAFKWGYLVGESDGLVGPFEMWSPVEFISEGPVYNGTFHGIGITFPMWDSTSYDYWYSQFELYYEEILLLYLNDTLLEWAGPMSLDMGDAQDIWFETMEAIRETGGVNKDVMLFFGTLHDIPVPGGWMSFDINDGLLQVINGGISGLEFASMRGPDTLMTLEGGDYCSTMAKDALRAINPTFLEDDSYTVKQMMPAELSVSKTVDKEVVENGDSVTFTVTVTNNGPGDATNVELADMPDSEFIMDEVSVTAGEFNAGLWTHIDMIPAGGSETLTMTATVDGLVDYAMNQVVIKPVELRDQADWNPNNDFDVVTVTLADPPPEPPNYLEIELDEGWNLISLPVIPTDGAETSVADYDINDVLGDIEGDVDDIFGVWSYWDEAWMSAVPIGGGAYAGDLAMVEDGKGFWINMDAAATLTVNGVSLLDAPALPPTYDLNVGWNLIGFKSLFPREAGDYLAGIAGKYVIIYRFVDGVYSIVQADENMMPGEGYWIAVIDTGTIYP